MVKDLGALLMCVWRLLSPPPAHATGADLRRWRIIVTVATMSNSAGIGILALIAFGAVPAVFAGFAPASKVEALQLQNTDVQGDQQKQLAQVQQYQLDSKIMETRIRQCRAMEARMKGNNDAEQVIQFATARLQEQLDDFWRLTSRRYRLPECSEV